MTTEVKMTKADQERLKRLAAFAPIFRNPQFAFGKWHYPTGEGPLFMAWFEKSEAANQFLVVTHEIVETLKRKGFDWTKWIEQPEGQRLFSGNIDTIASANGEQLAKLAFALVREDRFSEGRLAKAYDDKILLAIVERAEELLKGLAGPRNKLRAR